jgi:hypothetical protein
MSVSACMAWHDRSVAWTIARPLLGPPGVRTTAGQVLPEFITELVWHRRGEPDADDGFGCEIRRTLAVTRGTDGADLGRVAA